MDKNKLRTLVSKRRGLFVIVTAAVLLEFLSGAQFFFTHRMMEGELEKRAESELTLKAILIKSNLNSSENILKDYLWKIQAHIDEPDSAYITMKRMAANSKHLQGVAVMFKPYYYPQKGRLYEVYARCKDNGEVDVSQIGGAEHDYTKKEFYQLALQSEDGFWVDPYNDNEGAHSRVTSYFLPVRDRKNEVVGVAAVDLSQKWLTDTIGHRHIYPSSFIMLLTEDNVPVIESTLKSVSRETIDNIYALITDSTVVSRKSHSGRSTVVHFDIDNRDGTIYYAFMRGTPHWKIAVVCYDDEVYAPLLKLRIRFMLLMLLAFGILLYVVWRFFRGAKRMAETQRLLHEKMLEQERLTGELRIASGIQQALLPNLDVLSMARRQSLSDDEAEVEGRLIPAKAVGGDLYNGFVRDGKLFFCIGDVSGKGVPAALIMAVTQTLFRSNASRESNPAHIMDRINEAACTNNKSNMFVTMFMGVLDLPTGHLRYCNAGHEVPILISKESSAIHSSLLPAEANLPIGVFSDFKYKMQEITMQPGATLFLYTDGLTEARNTQHELFGRERLMQMMTECSAMDPKQLIETVIARVGQFSGDTEQSDDLTLLAVRYSPKEEQVILDEELVLPNAVKEVAKLSVFVKDVLTRLNIGKPLAPQLRLALEEAVVNVMEYAYPAGIKGNVTIHVTATSKHLKFIISDTGISFNPTESSLADTTLSAEERPVGGLGILLIRQLMDTINYERIDGKNILTLSRTLDIEH